MSKTDPSTYKFNHTMIRVKDPKASVKFYETLGMSLINKIEQPEAKFDLYFMGYNGAKSVSGSNHWSDREGLIELTHNYGSEDKEGQVYHNGNKDPRGFGHTCVSVDNLQAACDKLEHAGYKFQKKLTDGRMRNIAFALDPDEYWVEIIGQKPYEETKDIKETDMGTYRMNHTMIRIKDPEKTLKFYQDVFGMRLLRTHEGGDFNLYFLGYGPPAPEATANGVNPVSDREGLLEYVMSYMDVGRMLIRIQTNMEPRNREGTRSSIPQWQRRTSRLWSHLCLGGPS